MAQGLGAPRLYLETNSSLAPALALYRSFGFTALVSPDTLMERYDPNPYLQAAPMSKASND